MSSDGNPVEEVELPYMPEEGSIEYLKPHHLLMQWSATVADERSLDDNHPVASVIVKDNRILGEGANGSKYHEEHGCDREGTGEREKEESSEGYMMCEGCHPKNHSEPTAIQDAHERGNTDLEGAEVYMWGHRYACEWCWDEMLEAGIEQLYLMEGSERKFNKKHEEFLFEENGDIPDRYLLDIPDRHFLDEN